MRIAVLVTPIILATGMPERIGLVPPFLFAVRRDAGRDLLVRFDARHEHVVANARDLERPALLLLLHSRIDQLRIPQWAARASYNKNDNNLDLLWIPVPTFDNIGKPGADFYPYPLPVLPK